MAPRTVAIFGTLLAASCCAAESVAAEEERARAPYAKFELEKGRFACEVPAGWLQVRDPADDERIKAYGVFLRGPRADAPVGPTIALRYYTAENTLFSSAAAFLKRQLDPGPIPLSGEKTGAVVETKLAGLAAKTFRRDTFEYWPPRSLDTKEIKVREEHIILEHKEGFFVLRYEAPTSHFRRWRPAFQHVLDTFRVRP